MSNQALALTSLIPGAGSVTTQRATTESWRAAGLRVVSFNHPSELPQLHGLYDAEFVPTEETSIAQFGRHYIPVSRILRWAAAQNCPVMLVNADIEMRMTVEEFQRILYLAEGGLCYFIRHNHNGDKARAKAEPYGIDGFLFHSRDCDMFPDSCLSLGQPFWDYWLPHTFSAQRKKIFSIDAPVLFHRNHPAKWSWQNHHRCGLEFDRMARVLGEDQSPAAVSAMSMKVRRSFDNMKTEISPKARDIRQWVERTFSYPGNKTFLELGAHKGTDTAWMAKLPGVTIHAFEPDPRNHLPALPNVTEHRIAISDRDGTIPFILSKHGWQQEWTYSSSIKAPKNHLTRYPVTFGESVEVATTRLDTFSRTHSLGNIDFIWADIQGAEAEMIRGGGETLVRTRFLFTEYSDAELYEGQPSLRQILDMLPGYRVLELWPDDVLLENERFGK